MEITNDKEFHSDYDSKTDSTETNIVLTTLKTILRKWWIFLLIGIIAGIWGFLYASNQKPVYESYLSFALDEGGGEGGISGALGLAAQFGISIGGAKDVFNGDNIIEIMLSRRMIERVLLSVDTFDNKTMTFVEYYLEHKSSKNQKDNAVHFYPGITKSNFNYAQDSILFRTFLEFKQSYISAQHPNKKLNIYELTVSSNNERFSKLFTDKLIDETNKFYTEISSKKAKETLEILEKRVPDMKGKLESAITNRAAIQDANLNPAFANAQVPLLKEESNTQVYGAAYAEMFKNLEIARFQYLKSIPLMQVIDPADYPLKKIKPGKLKTGAIMATLSIFIAFILSFCYLVGKRIIKAAF